MVKVWPAHRSCAMRTLKLRAMLRVLEIPYTILLAYPVRSSYAHIITTSKDPHVEEVRALYDVMEANRNRSVIKKMLRLTPNN